MQVFTHKNENEHYITDGLGFMLSVNDVTINQLFIPVFEQYLNRILKHTKTEKQFREIETHLDNLFYAEFENGRLPKNRACFIECLIVIRDVYDKPDFRKYSLAELELLMKNPQFRIEVYNYRARQHEMKSNLIQELNR